MKNKMQNVLAQNSTGDIGYFCSKCGKEVAKEAVICNHCGAKLGNIKCPFCNFTGQIEDFKFDTCPKCGRKNQNTINPLKTNKTNPKKAPFPIKLFWFLLLSLVGILIMLLYIFLKNFNLL